ncbi:hypothetical protein PFISCL1PPCAC_23728, partial [Pristionchus fissidentatus]
MCRNSRNHVVVDVQCTIHYRNSASLGLCFSYFILNRAGIHQGQRAAHHHARLLHHHRDSHADTHGGLSPLASCVESLHICLLRRNAPAHYGRLS